MESTDIEETSSLLSLFYDGLKADPDATVVRFDDGDQNVVMRSYSGVDADSSIIAGLLIALKTAEEVICLSATPKLTTLSIIIGILKAESAFSFLDFKANTKYNSRFIERLGAKYVIVDEAEFDLVKQLGAFTVIKRIDCHGEELLIIEIINTKRKKYHYPGYPLAYCIETSGSTGQPKLVKVPHSCIFLNVIDFRDRFNVKSSDVIFVASPLTFDPSIVDIFLALSKGASVLLVPEWLKLMPDKLLKVLTSRNNVTVMQATPSFVKRFDCDALQSIMLSKDSALRILSLGGESCPSKQKLFLWKHRENKTEIYNVYGITEVSSWAMIQLVNLDAFDSYFEDVALGDPVLGTDFEVVDSEGSILIGPGVGHLYLGGSKRICFLGWEDYLVASKEPMRPTGDLVRVDSDGRIFYLGRLDDQIKRNGKKISVKQVEMMANSLKQVEDCKLLYDEESQELILAVILIRESRDHPQEVVQRLKEYLSRTVPSHSYPDHIITKNSFPITKNGKIDKKILLGMCKLHNHLPFESGLSSEIIFNNIKNLWKIYLGDNVDICSSSNFILLGGNSFNTIRLSNGIQSLYQTKDLTQLVDHLLNADLKTVCEYVYAAELKCQLPDQKSTRSSSDQDKHYLPGTSHEQNAASESADNVTLISRGNIAKVAYNLGQNSGICNYQITLREVWKFNTGKCVDASPFIIHSTGFGSVVYIGSHSHNLYAICIETGHVRWIFKTSDRIESSVCATSCGAYVFVGSYDKCLYCIEANSGIEKWKFKANGMIKCSPTYDSFNKCVYFGAYDHYVYAVEADSGECVWKANISSGSIFSSPCISQDPHQLYTGTLDGKLACLCPRSGKCLWKYNFDRPVFSSCRVFPMGICVGCVDNNIYCISHRGEKMWKFGTEEPVFSSPCIALSDFNKGGVVCGSHDKHLYCVDIENGILIWKTFLESPVYSTPFMTCVGKHNLYIVVACTTNGTCYCLNASNGLIVSKYNFPGETFSSPVIFNNQLVVGCRDNHVYSLEINITEIYLCLQL